MKKIIFLSLFIFQVVLSQERDALLESLFVEEMTMEEQLLPQKMIFTQSLLWGKKGLFRKTGISKLSLEQREKELKVRNVMLKSHQMGITNYTMLIKPWGHGSPFLILLVLDFPFLLHLLW
jgi:hypothetical protein